MKEIEKYIEDYFGIGGKNLDPIAKLFSYSKLKKDEYLLKLNQQANTISFVKSGFVRVYALSHSGEKEITQWISDEGMFITDLSSFIFGTPSRWNFQALTDCEIFTISREDYNDIGTYVENWSELDKLFISKCFITLENRVFNLLSMTAAEKVNNLMEYNSSIFNKVPLQHIASMLGMTPETLSRVRKNLIS